MRQHVTEDVMSSPKLSPEKHQIFDDYLRRAYLLEQGKRRVKGAHATSGDRGDAADIDMAIKNLLKRTQNDS